MQTFLPYKDFRQSARVLDTKLLSKQRVEVIQIMAALVKLQVHTDTANIAWGNHPATKMWRGHEQQLFEYQTAMCEEWIRRGYKDTCLEKTYRMLILFGFEFDESPPPWLGLKRFHSAHRANLLHKDPEHYGKYGWKEKPEEGYWWPVA